MKLLPAILAVVPSAFGSSVVVDDSATISYPNDEGTTSWEVSAANNGYLSMQFNADNTALDFFKFDCRDYVSITYSDGAGASFCGPNKSKALVVPAASDDIGNFKKSSKTGQRVFDYPYMTQEQGMTVEYHTGPDSKGSKFEVTFKNIKKEHVCKNRLNCQKLAPLIDDGHDGGYICKAHPLYLDKVCQQVDCTSNDHCGDKQKCKKNVCEDVNCKTNKQCGAQQICELGSFECKTVECRSHKHCADKEGGPYRCDGRKGVYECKKVECLTQHDCSSDSLCKKNKCVQYECRNDVNCAEKFGAPGQKCESGTCECVTKDGLRECVNKECKKHTHCDDEPNYKKGAFCYNNQCVIEIDGVRTCHHNNHCTAGMKCQDKRCVSVECKSSFDCDSNPKFSDKGPHLCYDENEEDESLHNTCYPVACKGHDDCDSKGDRFACIQNSCVEVTCRSNTDCGVNHLCRHPDKKDPRKNFCEKVDCTSHNACKLHENEDCKAGKCICKKNQCKVKQCVKSDHCPDKHNCHDYQCVKQECNTHAHCDGYDTPHKCFSDCEEVVINEGDKPIKKCTNTCKPVECKNNENCSDGDPGLDGATFVAPQVCDSTDDKNPFCKNVACKGHLFCGEQEICSEHKCKTVECRTNAHCEPFNVNGKVHTCDSETNKCKKVDCIGHDYCGEFERCKDHKCRAVSCTDNEHCPPNYILNVFQKCGKDEGKCFNIECQGHATCDTNANTVGGEDCTDGKCKCLENNCVKQECRTKQHCIEMGLNKHICENNICAEVTCTTHAHCESVNDGRSTCRENQCVNVDCIDRQHCGDKQICSNYKEDGTGNQCEDVQCTSNLDCETNYGPTYRCLSNVCEDQICRKNEHCWEKTDDAGNLYTDPDAKFVCEDNECKPVECAHHDHCHKVGDIKSPYICEERSCVKVDCRHNDHCKADEVCSNADQTCYPVECKGHAMCQEKAISGEIDSEACKEGRCQCVEHQCEVLECRKNEHCDASEGYICDTEKDSPTRNHCVKVDCVGHDLCLQDERPECQDGKCRCEKFECVPVSCRNNDHCDEGEICTGERVDNEDINGAYFIFGKKPNTCVEVDCKGHDDCGEKENCSGYQCVPVDCTTEEHCGEQELCQNAVCVEQECRDHKHCEGFFAEGVPYKCKQQTCLAVECTGAVDCGQGYLCDRKTNTCFKPECMGHASCELVAGCEDGKCRCETQKKLDDEGNIINDSNKCIPYECRTNDHCPKAKELCNNETNKCEKVDCTRHDHCSQKNGHRKCEENKCIKVDCITNAQCGDLAVCMGNTCYDVDCKTNGDCLTGNVCKNQTCVKVGCTEHKNCEDKDKPYCKRNQCVPMPRFLDIMN
jgi:hypothetical protein